MVDLRSTKITKNFYPIIYSQIKTVINDDLLYQKDKSLKWKELLDAISKHEKAFKNSNIENIVRMSHYDPDIYYRFLLNKSQPELYIKLRELDYINVPLPWHYLYEISVAIVKQNLIEINNHSTLEHFIEDIYIHKNRRFFELICLKLSFKQNH